MKKLLKTTYYFDMTINQVKLFNSFLGTVNAVVRIKNLIELNYIKIEIYWNESNPSGIRTHSSSPTRTGVFNFHMYWKFKFSYSSVQSLFYLYHCIYWLQYTANKNLMSSKKSVKKLLPELENYSSKSSCSRKPNLGQILFNLSRHVVFYRRVPFWLWNTH